MLSPNVTDIASIARSCEDEGADAISLINTLMGMAIDIERRCPRLSIRTGGLSGPAVKPVALRMVYDVSKAVKIPVIGLGGISNAEDAIEFFMAGATAIQIGTANFVDPQVTMKRARRNRLLVGRTRMQVCHRSCRMFGIAVREHIKFESDQMTALNQHKN